MTGFLVLTARFMLAAVFLLSTVTKLGSRAFLDWVRDLRVVPDRWVPHVGALLAVVEAVTLVLVLLPGPAGLVLAAVTMAFFAGSAVFLVRRGITVPCRCFGTPTSARPMGTAEIVRNVLLTVIASAAAVIAVLAPPPVPPVAAILIAVLLGGALGLVITRFDDLRQLFAQ